MSDGKPDRNRPGGTDRRRLLRVGGAVAVLGVGGFLAFDAQSGTGPVGTARSFVGALNTGDIERANELVHEEAPMGELDAVDFVSIATTEYAIESTEVVERTDDGATVTVTLSRGSSEAARTVQRQVELRRQEGKWRVWQYEQ